MGKEKHGFLTPKAISNRIKAKGLQKLRWYCQMCQKQCRDENGFKCHITCESHQRQLLLVADNPDKFVDTFSKDFCEEFIELLKRRFGTKRVRANVVYQEYIADRHHVHMNSTQWETLTEFVKWLGREGYCTVDETEKGWFMQYIDRDPETIRRQLAHQSKMKMDVDDEERRNKMIQIQVDKALYCAPERDEPKFTELCKNNEDEKIAFKMPAVPDIKPAKLNSSSLLMLDNILEKTGDSKLIATSSKSLAKKRKSALDEIKEMEDERREKMGRKDYWLAKGIVVKIVTKKLGEEFYKKKAVVKELLDNYTAIIKLLEGGDKMKMDQMHLETVLPSLGSKVLVVNGGYRGEFASLDSIDEELFSCTITIQSGTLKGRRLTNIQYEEICKFHEL